MKILLPILFLFLNNLATSQTVFTNNFTDLRFSLNGDQSELTQKLQLIQNEYNYSTAVMSRIETFLQFVLNNRLVDTGTTRPEVEYSVVNLGVVQIKTHTSINHGVWVYHYNIDSKRQTDQTFLGDSYQFRFHGRVHNEMNIIAAVGFDINGKRSQVVEFIITDMDRL